MGEVLADWLAGSSPAVILVVPVLAFLESCVGVGLFVSGIFLLTASTVLYAGDASSISTIVLLAFSGALAGDCFGYQVGRTVGPRFLESTIALRYRHRIDSALKLSRKSAPLTVCIGRLTPAIRSITPVIAGISGVTPARFLAYDLLACLAWATGLYLLVTGISSFA